MTLRKSLGRAIVGIYHSLVLYLFSRDFMHGQEMINRMRLHFLMQNTEKKKNHGSFQGAGLSEKKALEASSPAF